MRLWSQELISKLPSKQIGGQWRECIALLGNGWGRKHETVDYVFTHSKDKLVAYAKLILQEKYNRGHKPNSNLIVSALSKNHSDEVIDLMLNGANYWLRQDRIYDEHNEEYTNHCILNLKGKGINI